MKIMRSTQPQKSEPAGWHGQTAVLAVAAAVSRVTAPNWPCMMPPGRSQDDHRLHDGGPSASFPSRLHQIPILCGTCPVPDPGRARRCDCAVVQRVTVRRRRGRQRGIPASGPCRPSLRRPRRARDDRTDWRKCARASSSPPAMPTRAAVQAQQVADARHCRRQGAGHRCRGPQGRRLRRKPRMR